jgi:hypothetical protein
MNSIQRFQKWYLNQCDGDWEHGYGPKISTIDNPGWSIEIPLEQLILGEKVFDRVEIERTEQDWIFAWVDEKKVFNVACGPLNPEEALNLFCDWAE